MRILTLALKDLAQVLRDKKSLLFMVAMPIVFTLFMGFAYRGAPDESDPRLALGWVNHDPQGEMSLALQEMLQSSEVVRLEFVEEENMAASLQSGDLAGALIVPPGFSADLLAGGSPQLTLVADELSGAGSSLKQVMQGYTSRLMSAVYAAQTSADQLAARQLLGSQEAVQQEILAAFQQAVSLWQSQRSLVRVEKASIAEPEPAFGGNPYNQTSPGMLVMFAIFSLVGSAAILVTERRTRTLQRMLTTSLRPAQVIAGHLLAMFLLTFLQELLLVLFGQWALGVNYLRQPLGILLVMVGLALWVAATGLLIGVLAKNEEQVVLFSMVTMFVFAAAGGAWFPLEGAGRAFAAVGRLTPSAWAMTGFQNVLIRGLDVTSTLLPAGILLAYAAVFFLLAVWRFRVE